MRPQQEARDVLLQLTLGVLDIHDMARQRLVVCALLGLGLGLAVPGALGIDLSRLYGHLHAKRNGKSPATAIHRAMRNLLRLTPASGGFIFHTNPHV